MSELVVATAENVIDFVLSALTVAAAVSVVDFVDSILNVVATDSDMIEDGDPLLDSCLTVTDGRDETVDTRDDFGVLLMGADTDTSVEAVGHVVVLGDRPDEPDDDEVTV